MTDGDERGRGVLSPADRKYLRNPEEYSRQARHEREKAILERVENAILDFTILWEEWDREEEWHRRIWWEVRGSNGQAAYNEPIGDVEIEDGLRDMAVFSLLLARSDTLFDPEGRASSYQDDPYAEWFFLSILKRLGREYRLYVRDYHLEIESEVLMWGRLQERLEDGEDVPVEQLLWALDLEVFDVDAAPIQESLQEEFRKQLADEDEDEIDEE